jgi:hypothetical protein
MRNMITNLETRTATEGDLDQICVVADEVAPQHHGHAPEIFAAPGALRHRAFWQSWITQAQSTIHVAFDPGAVVGFISAKVAPAPTATMLVPRVICRIGTIVVSSSGRRQVVTYLEIFDFNRQALAFYEELGYGVQSHIMHRQLK